MVTARTTPLARGRRGGVVLEMTWCPSEPLHVWGHAIGRSAVPPPQEGRGGSFRNWKSWITALYSRGPEPMREKSGKRPLDGEAGVGGAGREPISEGPMSGGSSFRSQLSWA